MLAGIKTLGIMVSQSVLSGFNFIGGTSNLTPSGSTFTFNNVDIGTAASNRRVYIAVSVNKGSTITINSMTIGGITATKHADINDNTDNSRLSIFSAAVPTGTTATVVVTCSSTILFIAFSVYAYYGTVSSTTSFTTNADAPSSTLTLTTVPSNGFIIAGAVADRGFNNATYSGTAGVTTQDFVASDSTDAYGFSSGSLFPTTSGSSKTVIINLSGSQTNLHHGVAAIVVTP